MSYKITYRQQAMLDELKAFHFNECSIMEWKDKLTEPFPKNAIGPNEQKWIEKEEQFQLRFYSKIVGISLIFKRYYQIKRKRTSKLDQSLYQRWEKELPFTKQIMEGHQQSWREAVKKYASFHQNLNLAKAYSLYVYDRHTVECDVFIHSIDSVIPARIEKVTKRGTIRYHDMGKTKRNDLYQDYVYSCVNKIVNDLFAVLPCKRVFINAVIGSYDDHLPILSSVVERKHHRQLRCAKNTLEKQRHMVKFKVRTGFEPIHTIYSPDLLFRGDK
ncbi:hypothetical protein MM326_20690 [Alkalihalobacillus sp. LMS6]|uniref:hypothetical protein n=1 Tax=Bacillaceae TaxID=186817 RepID=UPI000C07DF97|nr:MULTISPECIES: hypothetical protein [Bacillaceae]UTR06459.1 hypothetical protein MM326_20690 [Alkalihalobacillus sp. LMS6]